MAATKAAEPDTWPICKISIAHGAIGLALGKFSSLQKMLSHPKNQQATREQPNVPDRAYEFYHLAKSIEL